MAEWDKRIYKKGDIYHKMEEEVGILRKIHKEKKWNWMSMELWLKQLFVVLKADNEWKTKNLLVETCGKDNNSNKRAKIWKTR